MCGILCLIHNNNNANTNIDIKKCIENISHRGPDVIKSIHCATDEYNIQFTGSVLWLQGSEVTEQPIETELSLFLYNGDIYNGIGDTRISGDTKVVHNLLDESPDIPNTLSTLQGPYAFIYFNKSRNLLYFGRDIFGRRSLLLSLTKNTIVLSSVAERNSGCDFIELPSIGTFCYNLNNQQLELFPWAYKNNNFAFMLTQLTTFLNRDITINKRIVPIENLHKYFMPNETELSLYNTVIKSENLFKILLNDEHWLQNVLELRRLLEDAIRKRIQSQPDYCKECVKEQLSCNHSNIGVLFSGGIDCAVLAIVAHNFVDIKHSIDLINVSFDETKNYESPDRITGQATFKELSKLCPDRRWNFVHVNVTKDELTKLRSAHIADLIYPLHTVLDDSLGCALWFASRCTSEEYKSPARVVLVGMGADELFGGYTRHRAAFKKYSWQGLHDVLNEDWQNLPYRNLARDDRVVSDHGRQLRTPYLDENLVEFVRKLPVWQKSWPTSDIPQGIGEKILLRSLAYLLGLEDAAMFKKRALQFGSRIANPKDNGHETSIYLRKYDN